MTTVRLRCVGHLYKNQFVNLFRVENLNISRVLSHQVAAWLVDGQSDDGPRLLLTSGALSMLFVGETLLRCRRPRSHFIWPVGAVSVCKMKTGKWELIDSRIG